MRIGINFITKNIFLVLILMSGFMVCQQKQFEEIDELLKKAVTSNKKYEFLKQLEYAKKASILAEKTNDTKRIAESYYQIANSLSRLELQKESIYYIEKASMQQYAQANLFFQIQLKELKSNNYNSLQLKSQSVKELREIIQSIQTRKDSLAIRLLARAYGNIGNQFNDANKIDSAFIYYRLEQQQLEKIPERNILQHLSEHYISMGVLFLEEKKSDSALYYFQKSYQLKQKYHDPALFMQYFVFGDYYYEQKQYQKALDFYLKVEVTPGFPANHSGFIHIYKKISEIYGILGNKREQDIYQKIYSEKQTKILSTRNRNVDYALNVILNEKKNEYISSRKKNYVFILIGVVGLILFFLFLFRFLRKNIKQKENIITKTMDSLWDKDEVIKQKTQETKELQQKVNKAYQEIIDLAKKNDPLFYFRFREVYPEFHDQLEKTNLGLRNSELILCAYTFLGFSIKDIADYTFKSVHTIRNRKQSLKKKFNIVADEDMGAWLRNLTDKN